MLAPMQTLKLQPISILLKVSKQPKQTIITFTSSWVTSSIVVTYSSVKFSTWEPFLGSSLIWHGKITESYLTTPCKIKGAEEKMQICDVGLPEGSFELDLEGH